MKQDRSGKSKNLFIKSILRQKIKITYEFFDLMIHNTLIVKRIQYIWEAIYVLHVEDRLVRATHPRNVTQTTISRIGSRPMLRIVELVEPT